MANHKSAVKAHKTSLKKRDQNKSKLSAIKTFSKKVLQLLSEGNLNDAKEAFKKAQSFIAKASRLGVLKFNNGSRKIKLLHNKIKNAEQSN